MLLSQIQANSKFADPTDIQVTEIDKKTVNGEVEMEFVSNGKGEPMEIDKMQIEGDVPNTSTCVLYTFLCATWCDGCYSMLRWPYWSRHVPIAMRRLTMST